MEENMISIVSALSKVYSTAGLVGKVVSNKSQNISKTKLAIMSVLALPVIAIVGKVAIATGVVSVVGYTSGKIFKRLQDRRNAS
jgi:hypothetical protein